MSLTQRQSVTRSGKENRSPVRLDAPRQPARGTPPRIVPAPTLPATRRISAIRRSERRDARSTGEPDREATGIPDTCRQRFHRPNKSRPVIFSWRRTKSVHPPRYREACIFTVDSGTGTPPPSSPPRWGSAFAPSTATSSASGPGGAVGRVARGPLHQAGTTAGSGGVHTSSRAGAVVLVQPETASTPNHPPVDSSS